MRRTLAATTGMVMVAISSAVAHEYKAGPIRVDAPWTRATPAGAKVAGGYMKIENTGKDVDRLIGGSVAIAGKFEIHEMSMVNNIMKMRELPNGLELKAGQTIELKPGSYHVMFMELKRPPREGERVKGTLLFEKAGKVDIEYTVRAMSGEEGDGKMKMKH